MHGLMNRALQRFVIGTYGLSVWDEVVRETALDPVAFEAMIANDGTTLEVVLRAARSVLGKPREVILEDVGTYLVSGPDSATVRRLLRFTGTNFVDFVHALDELPERLKLAIPGIQIPTLEVQHIGESSVELCCGEDHPWIVHTLSGLVRAMADDYGALVTVERCEDTPRCLRLDLHDTAFARGRHFALREGAR